MLYILHGNNFKAAREKLNALANTLQKKRPASEVFRLDDESFGPAQLEEYIGGQGLFDSKYIVILDNCMRNEDNVDAICGKLEAMAESDNVFLVLEGELSKKVKKQAEQHANEVQDFTYKRSHSAQATAGHASNNTKAENYNIFGLTDLLGKRDTAGLWAEFHRALRVGKTPEEIHGILFWQITSIATARQCNSAKEAGMKAYPYKKAKGFVKNFTESELTHLSSQWIAAYHRARMGEFDLEEGIEQAILEI